MLVVKNPLFFVYYIYYIHFSSQLNRRKKWESGLFDEKSAKIVDIEPFLNGQFFQKKWAKTDQMARKMGKFTQISTCETPIK